MTTATGHITVTDLVVAEDGGGTLCDHCSDPIDRGQVVACLSNGNQVHDDGCRPGPDHMLGVADELHTAPDDEQA